jgi:hypothetical protein
VVPAPSWEIALVTIRDVPPYEWPSFFDRFSRVHRAWRATVHGVEHGRPVTCVPSAAIESVALEHRVPDQILRLTFANGISLCALRPCRLRVQEADDGAEWALEVDTAYGAFIRMAFRATALPEQLDGIAPGEIEVEMLASR